MLGDLKEKANQVASIANQAVSVTKEKASQVVAVTKDRASLAVAATKQSTDNARISLQERWSKSNFLPKLNVLSTINTAKETTVEEDEKGKDDGEEEDVGQLHEVKLDVDEGKKKKKVPQEGNSDEDEESLLHELKGVCKLTKRQRLYGCLTCYLLGGTFSLLASFSLMGHFSHHLSYFALFYTLGNLSSIASSMFIVGPLRQLNTMCLPVRRIACIIWISMMCCTVVVAFTLPKAGLLILMLICVQYMAMFWYGASYIPYGRTIIMRCCKKLAREATSV